MLANQIMPQTLAVLSLLLCSAVSAVPNTAAGIDQSLLKRQASANYTNPFNASHVLMQPNLTSRLGVQTYNPAWHFPPTGPWSHVSKYGNTLYIAGQRGVYQENNTLVPLNVIPSASNPYPGYTRILKAYQNMLDLAAAGGASPQDCVRVVVYTTDMYRFRPVANLATQQLWGNNSVYPVRTIIEVSRLNDDDIIEVEGTFAVPV